MTNHQRDAAGDDSNDRADVQDEDDSIVVAARCFRVHVQRVAAIEHRQREEDHRNTTQNIIRRETRRREFTSDDS